MSDGVCVATLDELPIEMQLAYNSGAPDVPKIEPVPDFQFVSQIPANPIRRQDSKQVSQPMLNSGVDDAADEILLDFSEFDDTCDCPEGQCNCTNCFKHGRFGNVDIV